jgi:predicted phage-related endonuclease
VTAKEQLLKEAPGWSEATAAAVLRVVEAQSKLEAWFDRESKLSPEQVQEREARWARANARDLIREEPW